MFSKWVRHLIKRLRQGKLLCRDRQPQSLREVAHRPPAGYFAGDLRGDDAPKPQYLRVFLAVLAALSSSGSGGDPLDGPRARWTVEEAESWFSAQPWPIGANFVPSTVINKLEMWQPDTYDEVTIVNAMIRRFDSDLRVLAWDLFNDPTI